MRMLIVILSIVPLLFLSGGCASSSSDGDTVQPKSIALIIKLNSSEDEAVLRARLPALAAACALELEYLRPMSGGAHVVRMRADVPAQGLGCLRAQPDVVYVQEDKLARPMAGAGGAQ